MDAFRIQCDDVILLVSAKNRTEALLLAKEKVPNQQHYKISLIGKSETVVKGSVKDCCKDPENLAWVQYDTDTKIAFCKICNCRHFCKKLEPGVIGT